MTTEDRSAYTTGLRMLADVLDANPEIPLPFEGRLAPVGWFLHGDEQRDELAAIARAFPCNWEKGVWGKNDDGFILTGRLAGLDIAAHATRDQVCTRIVTGTEDREVEEVVTPAVVRKVTKPVEIVEWKCESLLAPGELADAAIEADPDGVADAVIAAAREPGRIDLGDDPDGDNTPVPVLAPYVFPGTGPRCRAIDSDQFICTAAPGHDGNHAAYAPDGELYATWPQDPPVPSSGPASLAGALKASLAADHVPVPSSGPLCAKCHSPGPLKTRGNGMQVCEDTAACGRRVQTAGAVNG